MLVYRRVVFFLTSNRWSFQRFFIFHYFSTWGDLLQFDGSHSFQMGGEKPPTSQEKDLNFAENHSDYLEDHPRTRKYLVTLLYY